ncbi:MAG: DUF4097 domain-containing protein [Oscillospiraceae bacterium]|jgi:DUF4097 and DUF4098 domain-containing protein YvlB|nr:DUF4097 domain-containing protein [Oscillospiraceae bacterium]
MKKIFLWLAIGTVVLGAVLLSIGLAKDGGSFAITREGRTLKIVHGQEYHITDMDLEPFHDIRFDGLSMALTIIVSDSYGIDMYLPESIAAPQFDVHDGILTAAEKETGIAVFNFGFISDEPGWCKIYVPAGTVDALALTTVSGDITVPALSGEAGQVKTCSIQTASGRIEMPEADRITSLRLETVSGDITFNTAETAQTIQAVSASGQIMGTAETVGELLKINTISGGISVQCADVGAVDLDASSGKIDAAFASVTGALDVETVSGDIHISAAAVGAADIYSASGTVGAALDSVTGGLKAETISGDIAVALKGADYALAANTISGALRFFGAEIRGDALSYPKADAAKLSFVTASGNVTVTAEDTAGLPNLTGYASSSIDVPEPSDFPDPPPPQLP